MYLLQLHVHSERGLRFVQRVLSFMLFMRLLLSIFKSSTIILLTNLWLINEIQFGLPLGFLTCLLFLWVIVLNVLYLAVVLSWIANSKFFSDQFKIAMPSCNPGGALFICCRRLFMMSFVLSAVLKFSEKCLIR